MKVALFESNLPTDDGQYCLVLVVDGLVLFAQATDGFRLLDEDGSRDWRKIALIGGNRWSNDWWNRIA